jgi:glycosyltransferase involved in cell wall biosynthesis
MPTAGKALDILMLEPYYGGSHRAFADGYRKHSRHNITLHTLPARKWKWRMRGSALKLARDIGQHRPDALLATDFLDLAALTALRPELLANVPRLAYFHENQLTYPLPDEDERDYQYGFTNITTCLAADRVLFNSRYHLTNFVEAVGDLLGKMPDCVPEGVPEQIEARSEVVPVGVNLREIDRIRPEVQPSEGPPLILWNHRWEFDKAPRKFFEAIERLEAEGCDFELAVVGQSFRRCPPVFDWAKERFAHRIRQFGYLPSREDYLRLLLRSDIVVSTAVHEFFGIAVVEAIYAGCVPVLPNRLSYPELLATDGSSPYLYETDEEMVEQLACWCASPRKLREQSLAENVKRFGWEEVAPRLDTVLEEMCGQG